MEAEQPDPPCLVAVRHPKPRGPTPPCQVSEWPRQPCPSGRQLHGSQGPTTVPGERMGPDPPCLLSARHPIDRAHPPSQPTAPPPKGRPTVPRLAPLRPPLGRRPTPPPCRTLRNESFCSAIMERNSLFQPRERSHDDQRRPWRPAEHQERPRPDPALPGGGAPGRGGRPQGTAGQDPVA